MGFLEDLSYAPYSREGGYDPDAQSARAQALDDDKLARLRRRLQEQSAAAGRSQGAELAGRGFSSGGGLASQMAVQRAGDVASGVEEGAIGLAMGRQQADEAQSTQARANAFQRLMQKGQYAGEGGLIGDRFASEEALQEGRFGEAARERGWQTGEREGGQGWQTGERVGGEGWRTGEREGTQGWQSGESVLDRSKDIEMQKRDLDLQYGRLQHDAQMLQQKQDWDGYWNLMSQMQELEVQGRKLTWESQALQSQQQYGAGMSQLGYNQDLGRMGARAGYDLGSQYMGISAQDRDRREGAGLNASLENLTQGWGMARQLLSYPHEMEMARFSGNLDLMMQGRGFNQQNLMFEQQRQMAEDQARQQYRYGEMGYDYAQPSDWEKATNIGLQGLGMYTSMGGGFGNPFGGGGGGPSQGNPNFGLNPNNYQLRY